SRTRRRGHRPRPRPGGAEDDAEGGKLVLRLDDGVTLVTRLRIGAEPLAVADEGLAQRRGRGDRVPRGHRAATHHAAERRRLVALDEDASLGAATEALEAVAIAFLEVLARVVETEGHGLHVHRHRLGLGAELVAQRALDR